jgi:hypothetical protein
VVPNNRKTKVSKINDENKWIDKRAFKIKATDSNLGIEA